MFNNSLITSLALMSPDQSDPGIQMTKAAIQMQNYDNWFFFIRVTYLLLFVIKGLIDLNLKLLCLEN